MKYLILMVCFSMAACVSQQYKGGYEGQSSRTQLSSVKSLCDKIYNKELSPPAAEYDIEVDVEDVGVAGDDNFGYYAVCHHGWPLPITAISGPGVIEFTNPTAATIYVRLTHTNTVDFVTNAAGDRSKSVDLIDAQYLKPSPGQWPDPKTCPKVVTNPDPASDPSVHYIRFALCPPSNATTNYYNYSITLVKKLGNGKTTDYKLDPQIIHHPN